jgi:hypothetical protein
MSVGASYIKTSKFGHSEVLVATIARDRAVLFVMTILIFELLLGEYCLTFTDLNCQQESDCNMSLYGKIKDLIYLA